MRSCPGPPPHPTPPPHRTRPLHQPRPRPLGRRERKKAATRRAIADAALRLFLERGYDAVGIREIADAADVSTTTLFKHFPVKEALVFDEDDDQEERLLTAVRERPALPEHPGRAAPHALGFPPDHPRRRRPPRRLPPPGDHHPRPARLRPEHVAAPPPPSPASSPRKAAAPPVTPPAWPWPTSPSKPPRGIQPHRPPRQSSAPSTCWNTAGKLSPGSTPEQKPPTPSGSRTRNVRSAPRSTW